MPTKKDTTPTAEKKTTAKKTVTEKKTSAASGVRKTQTADEATHALETAAEKRPVAKSAKPAAPKKPAAEEAGLTRIVAHVNIGHGNALFLRGEGGGLSWDAGVPMECVADDCWSWSVGAVDQAITFKVLINDQQWSGGDNLTVAPGETATFSPAF